MNYFDYLRHNRRYHPHGFTDHTKCKYNQHGEGGPCSHYQHFASADEARKWLYGYAGIEAFHVTDPNDVVTELGFSKAALADFKDGKPVSAEAFDKASIVFAQVCADIINRFNDITIPPMMFLPYDYQESKGWLGSAPADLREGNECYATIGDIFQNNKGSFGHPAEEKPYDVARHEFAHCLSTWDVYNEFQEIGKIWPVEEYGSMFDYLRKNVSIRGSLDFDEAIADVFAIRISPYYRDGRLPKILDDFVIKMLHQSIETLSGGEITMDSQQMRNRSQANLPYAYRITVDQIEMPPEGVVSWYDKAEARYVVFDTDVEMAHYAFKKLQIPEDLQKRLFAEFKGNGWKSLDVSCVKGCYYDLGKPYDEIIDTLNSWQR